MEASRAIRESSFAPGELKYLVLDDEWTIPIIGVDIPVGASIGVRVNMEGEMTPVYENDHIATFFEAVAGFVSTGLNAGSLTSGYYIVKVTVHKEVTVDPPGPIGPVTRDIPLRVCSGAPEFRVPLLLILGIPAAAILLLALARRRR